MKNLYGKLILPSTGEIVGTGWLPPRPDLRDYTEQNREINTLSKKLGVKTDDTPLPPSTDLRKWCSPVENQGSLGSCTAHAGVGIIEYYEKRAFNKHSNYSRLFLYKTTRNLMQAQGDSGGWLRCTMGAMKMCGIPAEKYWPYNTAEFDDEPDAFIYSVAKNFSAVKYFCHDPANGKCVPENVLLSVKKYLAAGIPSMFGFWGFPSFESTDVQGGIPFPCEGESAEWGHAIVTVGYDDKKKIKNTKSNKTTTGALLIRNSWGTAWGEKGYGWLPYEYVLKGFASDFWSLISMEWVDTGEFGV